MLRYLAVLLCELTMANSEKDIKENLEVITNAQMLAESWKKAADELYVKKKYQEALILYKAALNQDPGNSMYTNDLGLTLMQLKRYEEACSQFNNILERYGKIEKGNVEIDKHYLPMVPVLLNKASACNKWGQYEIAKNCCRIVLTINPSHKLALQLKADAYYCNNELSKAVAYYSKTLVIKPIIVSDSNWLKAIYNKGYADFLLEKYQDAILSFEAAIDQDPAHVEALYYRGLSKYILKEFNEAVYSFQCVLNLNSKSIRTWNNKAAAHYYLGNLELALQCYIKALEIDPNYALALEGKERVLAYQKKAGAEGAEIVQRKKKIEADFPEPVASTESTIIKFSSQNHEVNKTPALSTIVKPIPLHAPVASQLIEDTIARGEAAMELATIATTTAKGKASKDPN